MCSCSIDIETTMHFFLHCANFTIQRQTLFDKIASIYANIFTENEDTIVNTLLFGKPDSKNTFNEAMLNVSIEYILSTERFNNPLSVSFFFLFSFSDNQGYLIHTPGPLFSVFLFYLLSIFI